MLIDSNRAIANPTRSLKQSATLYTVCAGVDRYWLFWDLREHQPRLQDGYELLPERSYLNINAPSKYVKGPSYNACCWPASNEFTLSAIDCTW